MKTILVPIISVLLGIGLMEIESFVFGAPTGDWRIWIANTILAVLLAVAISHIYEARRYRAINGIPR